MAKTPRYPSQGTAGGGNTGRGPSVATVSASVEDLLLAALQEGTVTNETGRYLVTFRENAVDDGIKTLERLGMTVVEAGERQGQQPMSPTEAVDVDAFVMRHVSVALVGAPAAAASGLPTLELAAASPIEAIEPETYVFAEASSDDSRDSDGSAVASATDYLRGFVRAAETIAADLQGVPIPLTTEEPLVAGVTWGLNACRVPSSPRSASGIRVAVLDTGMDLRHPDFVGRQFVTQTFVGQPVDDLNSHGTHVTGTACGPKAPAGNIPRYGIGHKSVIYIGKVLTNGGGSVGGSVLAGMNWAIANKCTVINLSLGGSGGPYTAYTTAGRNALNNGLLMIAAAGNHAGPTMAPANSPTVMAVANLTERLQPNSSSGFGKIEIAAPGTNIFSSLPRPRLHGYKTGTSMATPHVTGCAALWAETSPGLRGMALWQKVQQTARRLSYPPARVGTGLVQAPQL